MAPWRQTLATGSEPKALVPATSQGGPGATGAVTLTVPNSADGTAAMQGGTTGAALPTAPKRKQVTVTEMLEYVKGLNIDPVKEAEMLWIAEEAFNAALPPGWSEHQDDQGRVYFHNSATGESTWGHPMDDLFSEVVTYQRRVVKDGGFWNIEDEIAELEENIREKIADWIELYDEHGEKFFYNRKNDESRFDDPRMAVYHNLYARLKLVAKMKERLPMLARRPRPEEPTDRDLAIQQRLEEEEKKYLAYLIKVQSFVRVILAKRKRRMMQSLRTVQKGPQPLRGKLRLRMEKLGPGGEKELVLSQTTGHRRHRAATKIQARVRGMQARKKFRPLIIHRAYLCQVATKIQATARVWLAKRRAIRVREDRLATAAVKIQRVYRGYRDRQYASSLRAEKLRFEWMLHCVIMIQSAIRAQLAYREFKRRRFRRHEGCISLIQQQIKMYWARCDFHRNKLRRQPITSMFALTKDPVARTIVPWSWQMWATPPMFAPRATSHGSAPLMYANLFESAEPQYYKSVAATKIQSRVRVFLAQRHARTVRGVVDNFWLDVYHSLEMELQARRKAAMGVQKIIRGKLMRGKNLLVAKKEEALKARVPQVKLAQAYMRKYFAQEWLQSAMDMALTVECTIKIQAHWRGWLARRHTEKLQEETLWPMKGWFEYTATGRDMVHLEVCFLPNPSFDDYKHFVINGSYDDLEVTVQDVEDVVARVLAEHGREEVPTPQSRATSSDRQRPSVLASGGGSRPSSGGRASRRSSRASHATPPGSAGSAHVSSLPQSPSVISSKPRTPQGSPLRGHSIASDDADSVSRHVSHASKPPRGPKLLSPQAAGLDKESQPGSARSHLSQRSHHSQHSQRSHRHSHRGSSSVPPSVGEEADEEEAERRSTAAPPSAAAPSEKSSTRAGRKSTSGSPQRTKSRSAASTSKSRRSVLPATGRQSEAAPPEPAVESPQSPEAGAAEAPHSEAAAAHKDEGAEDQTLPLAEEAAATSRKSTADSGGSRKSSRKSLGQGSRKSSRKSILESSAALLEKIEAGREQVEEADQQHRLEGQEESPEEEAAAAAAAAAEEQERQERAEEEARKAREEQAEHEEGGAEGEGEEGDEEGEDQRQQQQQQRSGQNSRSGVRSKKGPAAPPRERSPLAAESMGSLAQTFLAEAPKKYKDKPPPRAPEDEPRPPAPARAPSEPPAPSPSSSTKELSASASAAALRAATNRSPDPPVQKRKTYGGTLAGGKFVRAQADSVEDLSAADQQAILNDMIEIKQRKEQELREKRKQQQVRRKMQENASAEKMLVNMSEAEELEEERQRKKVKELKKWLRKKEEEQRARKARDAEMLAMVLEKENKKSETLKKIENERLAERERRLRQAELQKAHLEAKLMMSKDTSRGGKGATMRAQPTMLPPGVAQAPGPYWQQQQLQEAWQQQQTQQLQQHQQPLPPHLLQQLQQQLQLQQLPPEVQQQWLQQQLLHQQQHQQQQQQTLQMQQQQALQMQQQQTLQMQQQQTLQMQQQQQQYGYPLEPSHPMYQQSPYAYQLDPSQQPPYAFQPEQVGPQAEDAAGAAGALEPSQQQHLEQLHQLRKPQKASRVLHRHIHHHVHYHEGSDPESGAEGEASPQFATSPEQQRQIEMASEERVRAQLEAQSQLGAQPLTPSSRSRAVPHGSLGQPPRSYSVGARAPNVGQDLPTLPRSASLSQMQQGAGTMRTQEAFRQSSSLPALDVDLGRRQAANLQKYNSNVKRAIGSYADSGRPGFARRVPV